MNEYYLIPKIPLNQTFQLSQADVQYWRLEDDIEFQKLVKHRKKEGEMQ
jgi:hypothetical protein